MIKNSLVFLSFIFAASPVLAQDCPIGSSALQGPTVYDNMMYDPDTKWIVPSSDVNLRGYDVDNFFLIALINREIERRGGRLAVVFPPKRGLFIPDEVYTKARDILEGSPKQDLLEEYNSIIKQLEDTGAIVPQTYSAFSNLQQPYFQADHHWKPEAAAAAALAVWDALADVGILRIPLDDGGYVFGPQSREYKAGSYARVFNDECRTKIFDESYVYSSTYKTAARNLDQADSLFGDASDENFDVTLLGTSFSAESSNFQFYGALSYFLQAPVENIAVAGGAIDASFEILQTQSELLDANLVVWEIAPNHFPIVSHKLRSATATVLGGCNTSSSIQTISTQSDGWSDWLSVDKQSALVELDTQEYFSGQILVEAGFGEAVESVIIEKSERTPKEDRTSVWKTFVGKFDADGDITLPDSIRLKIVDATQDYEISVAHCQMENI
ncbi:acetyltransferase AlgX (SGNH hydrolase-like protein) [Pacificibacter maritimus]|uniref:Acetyltransferase AlgX (SGNH hydrolase-like protein) n=1 Tax=Pacificibacter maritimus TaxID=762213 RepID=A0A3N4VDC2_9RHOB|nr:hypothetical protein [Pacificibacter maritimus]RPE71860.1 acetyltransferase AlgX (SGNH hydrolase-like protein) [Pacificibacter maritimus]